MTRIVANKGENRLYITLSGIFDIQDASEAINVIRIEVVELDPGFDVINDLRFLKMSNLSVALKIKEGTSILEKHGAKRVVRVVGSSTFAVKIFAKFSSLLNSKTKVFYVPTMEKGLEILSQSAVLG